MQSFFKKKSKKKTDSEYQKKIEYEIRHRNKTDILTVPMQNEEQDNSSDMIWKLS